TNIPGVYAAGDLRLKEFRQIVSAVAVGAFAATLALRFVSVLFSLAGLPILTIPFTLRLAFLSAPDSISLLPFE
ncbi:thioredoxin reductase, partial [Enterococcus faecalis]